MKTVKRVQGIVFISNDLKQRKEVKMKEGTLKKSLLGRLFEPVREMSQSVKGEYNPDTQTWSHRDSYTMSPVKNNREE